MSTAADGPQLPGHIAIIMDGNGRWARKRHLPRVAGHSAGVKTLRRIVEHCLARGIPHLTVYAFSSENWQRPAEEVAYLMQLFISSIREQIGELHEHKVQVRFIGDRQVFPPTLRDSIADAERLTADNAALRLAVAANYGGRWDIVQLCRALALQVQQGRIDCADIDEQVISRASCMGAVPDPDLFIRTGGEKRISNYLLWQLAYTELYFSDVLWPDFSPGELDTAVSWYAERQRRFGRTSEQVDNIRSA